MKITGWLVTSTAVVRRIGRLRKLEAYFEVSTDHVHSSMVLTIIGGPENENLKQFLHACDKVSSVFGLTPEHYRLLLNHGKAAMLQDLYLIHPLLRVILDDT